MLSNGHTIYTFGYGGTGPILECLENIGDHLRGTRVRTYEVDIVAARLLAFARVLAVETDRITVSAVQLLDDAGIEVRARQMVLGDDGCDLCYHLEDFFRDLRISPDRPNLSWIT